MMISLDFSFELYIPCKICCELAAILGILKAVNELSLLQFISDPFTRGSFIHEVMLIID